MTAVTTRRTASAAGAAVATDRGPEIVAGRSGCAVTTDHVRGREPAS